MTRSQFFFLDVYSSFSTNRRSTDSTILKRVKRSSVAPSVLFSILVLHENTVDHAHGPSPVILSLTGAFSPFYRSCAGPSTENDGFFATQSRTYWTRRLRARKIIKTKLLRITCLNERLKKSSVVRRLSRTIQPYYNTSCRPI